jgi:hypothetical protein
MRQVHGLVRSYIVQLVGKDCSIKEDGDLT